MSGLPVPEGKQFAWDPKSTYVKRPPFFDAMARTAGAIEDIRSARVLAVLGDSVTTDHISPAGTIPPDSPAGKYLIANGVDPKDFNSYRARRGNHEVMVRAVTEKGEVRHIATKARIDTPEELLYYQNGGILCYVLRQLL